MHWFHDTSASRHRGRHHAAMCGLSLLLIAATIDVVPVVVNLLALQVVWPDFTLGDVLNIFKQGKSHLSLVRDVNDAGEVCGVMLLVALEGPRL